jgi:hypothetical protein
MRIYVFGSVGVSGWSCWSRESRARLWERGLWDYKGARCGWAWDGMGMDGHGHGHDHGGCRVQQCSDSASPVRGAPRAAWYSHPTAHHLTDTGSAASPADPVSYTARCNGPSADQQALRARPFLPWAHCGTEADGKVGTLELELACHASLPTPLPKLARALSPR